ncbi:hypothetical protein JJB09_00820 [Rhizobium sp. KVB221]|uniref:Uncharacterized protein n=1 Tax=Rhizobium setariae TaxID=2801340 RepID=A0A936YQ79_9HYPH|nr:DUF6880 family protein [Rhizobium setariae]MBL0370557.1 hypothetical protein [Rhizobium setariae]
MARQVKARLDAKGLSNLGLEKLVEILLEESVANKSLKARLQAALAGTSGPEEITRLIDKRLDALETAKTSINSTRARDLAVELSGLMRNIQSELGGVDAFAAFERLMRLAALRLRIEHRLKSDSARLAKVFSEVELVLAELLPTLPEAAQENAVAMLESDRKRDRYGERFEFFATALCGIGKSAADRWQAILEGQIKAGEPGRFVSRLLQRLFLHRGDLDAYISLEKAKPDHSQDSYAIAGMLHKAGRYAEALDWVRKKIAAIRILPVNGIATKVGQDYQARERKLLEADILDAMKERSEAQALRWKVFLDTFDADVLRKYISKLDDFAEFDELDKAFAAVLESEHIYEALLFLIEWPKRDVAATHVMAHAKKWDARNHDLLVAAASALSEDQPLAATVLFRILLNHILDRAPIAAYPLAVGYFEALIALAPEIEGDPRLESHPSFLAGIRSRHAKKYAFWQMVDRRNF